jgi:hypothetical protein
MNYIVSLTSIPTRFNGIIETINSIKSQSIRAQKIILNVPKFYKRFGETKTMDVPLISGVTINFCENDYGPATKIIPILKNYNSDQIIIYCDDDIIYKPNWAESLLLAHQNSQGSCVCGIGQSLDIMELKYRYSNSNNIFKKLYNSIRYKSEKRAISKNFKKEKYAEIAAGYGGVLIKPMFFNDNVFNLPNQLWSVDDIWLSGNLNLAKTLIMKLKNGEENFKFSGSSMIDPLTKFIYNNSNRDASNYEGIKYFRENYNIWNKNEI